MGNSDPFQISLDQHLLESVVHCWPACWKWLGNLESRILRERIESVPIDRPIYVAGLARSGSTILLEFLAAHPEVATHRYSDFPLIFTPWWSHELQRRSPTTTAAPVERAHGDGIAITPASPEAMEEPLWMAYFKQAHDRTSSQVLNESCEHRSFEKFYRDHLRKLLLIRGGSRYVSKGNYNVTRLAYLQKLFSDLRVVVPVRHPVHHIASLMKQQRLFVSGETNHPRALAHMQRVGHFEFGLDRRPINAGDGIAIERIQQLWSQGEEVRGWAAYWSHLYQFVIDDLQRRPTLRQTTLILRFEDLCDDPHKMLAELLRHGELEDEGLVDAFAPSISAPTYYRPDFSERELAIIAEETEDVASRLGYVELTHSDSSGSQTPESKQPLTTPTS